jgi:hypothetical protein
MPDYEVISPENSQTHVGRSYQDLAELWTQWFISDNPDAHNYSNVVFLRGVDFSESPEKTGYSGQPAMMVGTRSLSISCDQYLFLPVICTIINENDDNAKTAQERSYLVWDDTNAGDNPPAINQINVDEKPLDTQGPFLAYSRDFILNVPDVPYGRSLKEYLDIPLTKTGNFQAMTGGWWLLFKFKEEAHKQPKTHSVAFQAQGIRGPFGQYIASGIYTINVSPSGKQTLLPPALAPIVKQNMHRALENRKQKNELSEDEYNKLKNVINALGALL